MGETLRDRSAVAESLGTGGSGRGRSAPVLPFAGRRRVPDQPARGFLGGAGKVGLWEPELLWPGPRKVLALVPCPSSKSLQG